MQNSFFSRLEERARKIDSLLCVGLDPHDDDLIQQTPEAMKDFCLRLIQATADLALAFKPNMAFFEAFGPPGLQVLQEVIAGIPGEVPVILDAKRGDISSTAQAYAKAIYEIMGADAVTLSPYLGYDSIEPFLRYAGKGVFLLCKTSNPGAADLQDLPLYRDEPAHDDQPLALFEAVAARAQAWNESDNLGLVVGATYPEALKRVRRLAPELWILAPGVGVQGGDLLETLKAGLRPDGLGILVPVSRAISRAAQPRQEAKRLILAIHTARQMISEERGKSRSHSLGLQVDEHIEKDTREKSPELLQNIADGLLSVGCVKFGSFTLKSGMISPIYLDLRLLVSYPELLRKVAHAYAIILKGLAFDRLAALPYAALPIGTAISLSGDWSLIYPRKEVKAYGTQAEIEGEYHPGEKVVVIDDLATTGGSKFEVIDKLEQAGLLVHDVVVLIDRQSGARRALAGKGYQLHAVFTLTELLDYWEAAGKVAPEKIAEVRQFLLQ